jgi:hypothetical protein
MSSIGSSTSTIVSFRGNDEVDFDVCLDELYGEMQQQLNYSQCSIRQLAASSEQDNEFLEAVKIYFELDDYVESLVGLFKELQGVSKQCLGPTPKENKEQYAKMVLDRKEKKKREKEEAKVLNQLKTMDIINE